MLLLSEDEVYSGCQSPWQEEKGGRQDYKIQFRAIEGVDLLYKVPLSCFPFFSLRRKHTCIHTLSKICYRIFSLCVFVVISSKTEDPYLSQLQGQAKIQMLLIIHRSLVFVLSMYDYTSACVIGRGAWGREPHLQHFSTCIIIQPSLCREEFF